MPDFFGGAVERVLIIEDDRFNRRLYCDLLETEGWAVEAVSSARAGLDAAQASCPAIVVMDLELPDMDGVQATRALRADERTAEVPILIVSAHAQQDHAARASEAGADGFLRKPLAFNEFVETLRRLLIAR